MDIEALREYVLTKENVSEGFPFGETVLVFKVNNKIFLLLPLDEIPLRMNVKCDPDHVIELREEYPDHVLPGYHMNKKHWNTVMIDGHLKDVLIKEMIDESYRLVATKK
jgi:predicted DNA-binding protein (MmcQ/YjbR family)